MKGARVQLALAALLAALHVLVFLGTGPVDDEYICWRYARNFVSGAGLTFNPGEPVQGFTCPAWVGVHALGQAVGIAPVTLTRVLGALAAAGAALAAGVLWRIHAPRSRFLVPAFLVAASPAVAFHAAAGLGTVPLAACLMLAWLAWERARAAGRAPLLAALALAAAVAIRQEALLFALPFAWLERRRPVPALLPLLVPVVWAGISLSYYGRLLPETYALKKLPWRVDLAYGWRYLSESTWVAGIGLWLLVAPLAAHCSRPTAAFAAGAVVHAAYVVFVGGDYLAQARFFVPALAVLITLGCLALRRRPFALGAWSLVLGTGPLLAHLPWHPSERLIPHSRAYLAVLEEFQEERWLQLGRALAARAPRDTRVALSPIGAFGWESGFVIYDPLGLTLPDVAKAAPDLGIQLKGHHRHSGGAVLEREPDWVILGNGVREPATGQLLVNPWERELYQDPRFQRYERILVEIPGGAPLDLWVRRGSAAPD